MRRAVLLVSGARLGSDMARMLTRWWEGGREEVLLLQVEEPGRLVFVDLSDPGAPRVLGDTAAGEGLVVLGVPKGREDLEAALQGARLLGAEEDALRKLAREELFPDGPGVVDPPPESVDLDETWLTEMAKQAAADEEPGVGSDQGDGPPPDSFGFR